MKVKEDNYRNETMILKKIIGELDTGAIFTSFEDCFLLFTIEKNIIIVIVKEKKM